MITKIDIEKFGLFENYNWDGAIGRAEVFRRVNIIYGRNYSGKTTLSRILKCAENKVVHPNYEGGKFSIGFSNSTSVSETNLDANVSGFDIRVYNSDFVKENLSWLHNEDGSIKPFTILGAKNVEIDNKIKEIDVKLGSVDGATGLLSNHQVLLSVWNGKRSSHVSMQEELDKKLRDKAQQIKINGVIYNRPNYNINAIKGDIDKAQEHGELVAEAIHERKALLKEEPKLEIEKLKASKPNFSNYYKEVEELLQRPIKPSQPIVDLVNDSLLQEWVRQGIERHKGTRDTCGFCGNPISGDLWSQLDAHFSKESEDLRNELASKIEQLEAVKVKLAEFLTLTKDQFYSGLVTQFETSQKQWDTQIKVYSKNIASLISELDNRKNDIFKERTLPEITDISEEILGTIGEFNKTIEAHNKKTSTLSADQQKARGELLYSEVAKFLQDIDYPKKLRAIEELKSHEASAKENFELSRWEIETLTEERRALEAQSKDESKGAELVNQHLSHFFGHNELKLVAEGDAPNIFFRISRDNGYAKNLSEGECSLISFCYFIARIEDELASEHVANKLVIYIDDPISSLDSNHIFFMFSLIEAIIAKPKKYCQLFISTHNLDFLKYLKQLTFPEYKPDPNAKKYKKDVKHFMIERKGKASTILRLSPKYLKEYITEFNYLFHQIYKCSIADNQGDDHVFQYNFGNNMRKFLEAYLFYKFPNASLTFDQRLQKFFGSDNVAYSLVNRVINEYSHLGETFGRGLEPIDIGAIKEIAVTVIGKIEATDKDQFDALIDSIKDES